MGFYGIVDEMVKEIEKFKVNEIFLNAWKFGFLKKYKDGKRSIF